MVDPYQFPKHADVIAADAADFRTSTERVRCIVDLANWADRMVHQTSRGLEIESEALRGELRWRLAHQKVIADHAAH